MEQVEQVDSPLRAALGRCWEAQAGYIADGRKDFAAMAATLHPEIVLEQPESLPYGGEWRGHDELRRWLEAMDAVWSAVEVTEPVIVETAGAVIVQARFRATGRESGRVATMPICEVVSFKEGLPVGWRVFYFDTAAILAALD
jgi:hypothetical protein